MVQFLGSQNGAKSNPSPCSESSDVGVPMLTDPGEWTGNQALPSRKADTVCKRRLLGSWLQSGSDINLSISRPLLDARLLVWGLDESGTPWL